MGCLAFASPVSESLRPSCSSGPVAWAETRQYIDIASDDGSARRTARPRVVGNLSGHPTPEVRVFGFHAWAEPVGSWRPGRWTQPPERRFPV
mmetsp:Transcript_58407/g.162818  ORF Transcript_58407/g.162818 Transcript_58407/m.162818 type:complete len:92 (-) Transcript_58407:112-387(-)